MPRTSRKKKTVAKKKEISPEAESPTTSEPTSPKKASKTKKSKSNGSKTKTVKIAEVKPKRSSAQYSMYFRPINAILAQNKKKKTDYLLAAGTDETGSIEFNNYDQIDASLQLLNNSELVKVEFRSDQIRPVSSDRYNSGTISYKIIGGKFYDVLPSEKRKIVLPGTSFNFIDIEKVESLDDATADICFMGKVLCDKEETYTSSYDQSTFTSRKISIGDLTSSITLFTDDLHFEIPEDRIVAYINGYKMTKNGFTNVVNGIFVRQYLINEFYKKRKSKLIKNDQKIKQGVEEFDETKHIDCTIRKFNQKLIEVETSQQKIDDVYQYLKLNVNVAALLNPIECTYLSLKSDRKKLQEDELENIDEKEITNRFQFNLKFTENSSKHNIKLTVWDEAMEEYLDMTANEFEKMNEEEQDDLLDDLEETNVILFIKNKYETFNGKLRMKPSVLKFMED